MAQTNLASLSRQHTHEGAVAKNLTPKQNLERLVFAHLLWEDSFYVDGVSSAIALEAAALKVSPMVLADIAYDARNIHHLRHTPLFLAAILAVNRRDSNYIPFVIDSVIQRPDEMGEFLSLYARLNNRSPKELKGILSAKVKKAIAKKFTQFSQYQLAKYNRDAAVTLRDILRLTHPKPTTKEQAQVFNDLVNSSLPSPDTWEVALSSGADKKETFTRLIKEGALGYLALLRNLRNMSEAGVDPTLIKEAILAKRGASRVLPFRYVAAARAAPEFERELDFAMTEAIRELPVLDSTIVLVDVSGSMEAPLSRNSDISRMDAAAALATFLAEKSAIRIFTFSREVCEIAPRKGMALIDAIENSQIHSSTFLGAALKKIYKFPHNRLIVITDEQSHDAVPDPVVQHSYMINVAAYQRGVGYGPWIHFDGFSENIIKYIHIFESE